MATIYVGENAKKLGLRQYQIFSGELPAYVQAALKANPGLANSFVPFEHFVAAKPPGSLVGNPVAKKVVKQGPPIRNLK